MLGDAIATPTFVALKPDVMHPNVDNFDISSSNSDAGGYIDWNLRNLFDSTSQSLILHNGNALTTTSTFSDVYGCFNNVPQGYPSPPRIGIGIRIFMIMKRINQNKTMSLTANGHWASL